MPLQTVRTSNSSLSSRAFVRVRRFEAAYRLVFVRPALPVPRPGRDREAREYMNIILVRKDYSVRSSKPNPCMPGLGQGHGKKRHLHAHSPVNFKELKCYQNHYFEHTQGILFISKISGSWSGRIISPTSFILTMLLKALTASSIMPGRIVVPPPAMGLIFSG